MAREGPFGFIVRFALGWAWGGFCLYVFNLQVKMNRMRQRIAQRLKEAQNTCAMLTTFNEIDMRWGANLFPFTSRNRWRQSSLNSSQNLAGFPWGGWQHVFWDLFLRCVPQSAQLLQDHVGVVVWEGTELPNGLSFLGNPLLLVTGVVSGSSSVGFLVEDW